MIDMGNHHGQRVFYTAGRSLAELIESGEVVAIPDATTGLVFKRPVNCAPVELAAALTVVEAQRVADACNAGLDAA